MLGNEYLVAPAIAMSAVGVLSLVLRWIYHDDIAPRRPISRQRLAPGAGDYGLLVAVATIGDSSAARALQGLLAGHGIRATLGAAENGAVHVLVFRTDEGRARALLAPSS